MKRTLLFLSLAGFLLATSTDASAFTRKKAKSHKACCSKSSSCCKKGAGKCHKK